MEATRRAHTLSSSIEMVYMRNSPSESRVPSVAVEQVAPFFAQECSCYDFTTAYYILFRIAATIGSSLPSLACGPDVLPVTPSLM